MKVFTMKITYSVMETEEIGLIDQINDGLSRYYAKCSRFDYFNEDNDKKGKFKFWCDENGYDDQVVLDELSMEPNKCLLCDQDGFDFKDFPFYNIEDTARAKNDKVKQEMIFGELQKCKNSDAYKEFKVDFNRLKLVSQSWKDVVSGFIRQNGKSLSFAMPEVVVSIIILFYYEFEKAYTMVTSKDWALCTKEEMEKTHRMYQWKIPSLWDAIKGDKSAILRILTIGRLLRINYLRFLADTYMRDRIEAFVKKGRLLRYSEWVELNGHMQELKRNEYPATVFDDVKQSIMEIHSHVFLPPSSLFVIDDFIEEICEYILSIIELVHKIASNKDGSRCPFQVDYCIIFDPDRVGSKIHTVSPTIDDQDDEDSDDEDDEEEKQQVFDYICDIKERLKKERLLFTDTAIDNVSDSTSFLFKQHFDEFRNMILKKYSEKCNGYPQNKRFICAIDRRKPNEDRTYCTECDELIFFEPPDCCNTIPNNHAAQWYFDSSLACIIPNIGFNNDPYGEPVLPFGEQYGSYRYIYNGPITSEVFEPNLMTFSFHVESCNEIKAYLYFRGAVIRFMPEDIINLLPGRFVENEANKQWIKSQQAQEFIAKMKQKLYDCTFDIFYEKYKVRMDKV